jgi:TRAP-type C4-dicarboxylate transport system substrate-binding protein
MTSNIHSRTPIRSLAELKGKIIGATSQPAVDALNSLGASGTLMTSAPDIYLAMQRGVIDGMFAAWAWVENVKLLEVAPYHLMLQICPGSVSYVMRNETFNKFTPVEQFMLKQYKYEGIYRNDKGAITGSAMTMRAQIPASNFFQLSAADREEMKKLFQPSWDKWVKDMGALGYPANDILKDTLSLVNGYTSD